MDKTDTCNVNSELQCLLEYVQKTNPSMTLEKLKEELSKNNYSANSLIKTFKETKR